MSICQLKIVSSSPFLDTAPSTYWKTNPVPIVSECVRYLQCWSLHKKAKNEFRANKFINLCVQEKLPVFREYLGCQCGTVWWKMIFFNSSRVLEGNVIHSVNLVAKLFFLTHGAQLIRKNDEQQKSFHTPILIGGDIVGIKHYCKCSSKHIMCECVMLFCRSAAQIFRGDVL